MSGALWNAPPPTYDTPSSSTSLTPYLTLPHLLSLTWLAYPILSLIFVAFRLQLSLSDAQNGIASAKTEFLASCKAAETAATSAASMPRFMAVATNKQYADAVNGALNAARATLVLALTIMEVVINFLIDIYRSTFLCFVELVVRGGLAVLIAAVQEINNVLQSVTSALRTSIQNDIASANNVIASAINAINKVNPFGDITAPQITVPSLDSLQNVTLPASFQDALTNLNNSIPSVAQIKDQVEGLIDTPFELLKQDINDTFAGINFTPEGLPVPALDTISFCDQLDTSVIDDVGRDLIKMVKIGIVIIVLLALLLIGLNCLLTWYKWRCMKSHLEYTRQAWSTDPTMVHVKTTIPPQVVLSDHNLIMLQANSEHPLITRIMNNLSTRFNLTPTQHTNTQWFLHYITYRPALACLLIGVFGLISVQIQLWALGPLVAKYQDRAAATATDFSTTIATSINQSMYNQSSIYANEINTQVDAIQTTINNGLFGWVNGTTTQLNTTINNFYSDIQNVVTTVFGGTILAGPANDFLQCFLGSKVDAIENALTFLHDNLNIDIPRVNQSVLVLSPDTVNEAAQPIALAAIGGGGNTTDGSDNDGGLIGRLVNSYAAALRKERIMFAIFIALWGLVVLMGLAVVLWHTHGKHIVEQRGRRRWEREQRAGGDGGAAAFFNYGRSANGGSSDKEGALGEEKFSPLPSPRGSTFKPFWPSRENSPVDLSHEAAASQESVATVAGGGMVSAPASKKTQGAKLLAVGRRAMGRMERLKRDGSEEELQPPLVPTPAPETRSSPWFGKIAALLTRKDTLKSADADFWDNSAQVDGRPRPQLVIQTYRGSGRYGPPPSRQVQEDEAQYPQDFQAEPVMRSRFSVTPDATKTSYMAGLLSPSKKTVAPTPPTPTVIVSPPGHHTPTVALLQYPPIGVPIRSRQEPSSVPTDVGTSYTDDPFLGGAPAEPSLPIPLYASFDNVAQYGSPPRHPQLQAAFGARKRQDASPPPPFKSPRMLQPPMSLAPPPAGRHRRSVSSGAAGQWRVTNAAPGDSTSSLASEDGVAAELMPVTRLLTTTHARQSSMVNPFITPFDDEHRVQIDYPTGLGARKSMATNPFAPHAI